MKRFLVVALALAGFLAAGLVLFVQLYSPEAQRLVLERRLTEAFGTPAHVGSLRLTLVGGLGAEARNVRVELDPAYGEGSLLEVDVVRANVSVWRFLTTRELGVRSIDVVNPRFRFVKNPSGDWNWSTLGAPGAPLAKSRLESTTVLAFARSAHAIATDATSQLDSVDISGAEVTLVDSTVEPPVVTEYRGLALAAEIEQSGSDRRVRGTIIGDSAAAGGEPLSIAIPFDTLVTRSGDSGRWTASGTIDGGRLATRNTQFDAIETTVTLDGDQRLSFPRMRLNLFGGAFEGSASVELGTSNNRFALQGNVVNLDISRALAPKPELAGQLQGRATASARLTGDLGPYLATLESLEGDGNADVADFRLESTNLMSEISKSAKLSLIEFSETDTRVPGLSTGFRFERGSLRLTNATASKISGCVDLVVRDGLVGLGRKPTLNLTGSVTIFPEIQERIRADSSAARLLVGAITSRGEVTVPLRVRGTLVEPSVELDWTSVARSLLFGAIRP